MRESILLIIVKPFLAVPVSSECRKLSTKVSFAETMLAKLSSGKGVIKLTDYFFVSNAASIKVLSTTCVGCSES
jgi:hypothetical protein